MKAQWDNLSKKVGEFHKLLGDFLPEVSDKKNSKAVKLIESEWNTLVMLHNEVDKLVEPVAAIEVKMPFQSAEFAETWKFYKEYLQEAFGAYIPSRREVMQLRRLAKMADKNEKKAIDLLEYFMSHGSKGIYKPTEKQLTGEEPAKAEEANLSGFDPNAKQLDV